MRPPVQRDAIIGVAALAMLPANAAAMYLRGADRPGSGNLMAVTILAMVALVPVATVWLLVAVVRDRRAIRRQVGRLLLLGVLVAASLWYALGRVGFDFLARGLRSRISSQVSMPELQAAAVQLLNASESSGFTSAEAGEASTSPLVPEPIRRLRPRRVWVPGGPGADEYVSLSWGSCLDLCEVWVGPPGFVVTGPGAYRWYDGIYARVGG
jgi:hypothetical protein